MTLSDVHVLLGYKSFAEIKNISHTGLGVSSQLTAKYLVNHGIRAQVVKLRDPDADIRHSIEANRAAGYPVTHVVIAAPWVKTEIIGGLCRDYPFIRFAVCCHSNVGFLQADGDGARIFRQGLRLEAGTQNFSACANSRKFCKWVEASYRFPCHYLPNLYHQEPLGDPTRPGWSVTGGVLRIGIFCAPRAQKNIVTQVCAAINVGTVLKAQTEIWISVAREDDQSARMIMHAVRALTEDLPHINLKQLPWAGWPDFRKYVANKHCLLNVSYTESHNLVVCDGCNEGVPSVISSAIDWAPSQWVAEMDDTLDVADKAISLIMNPNAGRMGVAALKEHNDSGLIAWQDFFNKTTL